jgi:hypothetical protein
MMLAQRSAVTNRSISRVSARNVELHLDHTVPRHGVNDDDDDDDVCPSLAHALGQQCIRGAGQSAASSIYIVDLSQSALRPAETRARLV